MDLSFSKKLLAELEITGTVEVEVLRTSPVNSTGVLTPDLVGCPQNDNLFSLSKP